MLLPDWTYNKQPMLTLEDFPEDVIGFIYKVEFSNGMKYIGKKGLYSHTTKPPLKGKKRRRKVTKESTWKKYFGSLQKHEDFAKIKRGGIMVTDRKILYLCTTKWDMTYYETRFQFISDCLLRENYYNRNILGKFYPPKKKQDDTEI